MTPVEVGGKKIGRVAFTKSVSIDLKIIIS